MKALSICSGIDAASVAWKSLPIDVIGLSEIDRFPSAVLAHHYPNRHNFGDFTKITKESLYEKTGQSTVDVLIGGTPCQSFSIAGLREGLGSENGNLALEYLKLAQRLRPRWIVWENVPGVLSAVSHAAPDPSPPPPPMDMELDGQTMDTEQEYEAEEDHAFSYFLAGLSELGYGWAYRIMDAQYFGVPQRRRRVFVVGHSSGDWRRAAAVLFEQKGLSRNPPPRRKEGERTSGTAENGAGSNGKSIRFGPHQQDTLVPSDSVHPTLQGGTHGNAGHLTKIIAFTQNTRDEVRDLKNVAGCLGAQEGMKQRTYLCTTGQGFWTESDKSGTIRAREQESHEHLILSSQIRRLTPIEAERLQGFPDNYTRIPYRGKPADQCPDGPRYKALGNSMAVPVIKWIGKRILLVEEVLNG